MISVLLVDDEALVRAGLRMILESAGDIVVADEVEDGQAAVDRLRRTPPGATAASRPGEGTADRPGEDPTDRPGEGTTAGRPDVVLMDIRMPRLDGVAATAAVRASGDPVPVLVLTTFDTDEEVFAALAAGANGFLLKDTPPHDLIRAVRLAAAGDSVLSPVVTRRVIERFTSEDRTRRRDDALRRLDGLTVREREVLVEIGRGHANADIATRLHLSEATVKSHITHLFEKLGVTNRVQLAIAVFRAGLVE